MVKWALLIFLLIILLYFANVYLPSISLSSISEGFSEKALDRANPLAANELSSNNKIPIGISKADGIIQKLMHQTALNIPTSLVSENALTFSQVSPKNPIYPRIDNENSFLGLSKFCKDNAVGENPFSENNDSTFDKNCGVCFSSGTLADGTPFSGKTGIVVYNKDKQLFNKEKEAKRHPFTRAIPSIKDGSRVSCNDSSKGPDAKPVLAINKKDYDAFKKRGECIDNKQIGGGCGVCLNTNTISWVDPTGNFKSRTLYLWGSGSATLSVGGVNLGSEETLDTTNAKSYNLDRFTEGDMVELTVTGPSSSVYGAFISKTPSDGKYVLAIDKFLLIDMANNGYFPRSGGSKSVTIEGVSVKPILLRAQTASKNSQGINELKLQGNLPLTFVDSDQLAAFDCPNAPYITKQDDKDIFGVGGPCIIPTGQKRGLYTDECLKDTLISAGCSTGGTWYSDLDILRVDMANKSLAELTTDIKAGSSKDTDFQLKCYGIDLTTPCDKFLESGGTVNKACLTYLYNGGDSRWTQRELGPIYTGASSGDKCTPAGTMNPTNENSQLFAEAIKGIDAVKTFLTETLRKARGNLNINKSDEDGGRNTSYNMCIGPSPIPTPPPPPPSPAPPDPPRNPIISTCTLSNKGSNGIVKASWGTPVNKGANATGIRSYSIILYGKKAASENFDEIKKFYNIYGNSSDLSYTGLVVFEKWYFTITAKNDKGIQSDSVQSNTFIVGDSRPGPCPTSVIIRPNGTHLSKASEILDAYADIYPNGDYQYEWSGGPNVVGGNMSVLKSGSMGSTRNDNLGMMRENAPTDSAAHWNYKLKVTNPGCDAKESAIRVRWY